jgi:hypothetical protein
MGDIKIKLAKECRINDRVLIGGTAKKILSINLMDSKVEWNLSDKSSFTIPVTFKIQVEI